MAGILRVCASVGLILPHPDRHFPSHRHTTPVEPAPSAHVVGHAGQRHRRQGALEPDGADEQRAARLLAAEDVFDGRADRRFRGVATPDVLRHRPVLRLLAVDLAGHGVVLQPGLILLRPVGGIGPYAGCQVGLVDQALAQPRPVMGRRIGREMLADDPVATVDGHMVLVAEGRDGDVDEPLAVGLLTRLGELHRPACITVLLAQPGWLVLPALRLASGLDRVLLVLAVALPRAQRPAWRR